MTIDWKKKGQVVDVGWDGNISCPQWGRSVIQFYVDEHGNFFGCESNIEPKFNPITGEKIESICLDFAETDYNEDETDDGLMSSHE